MKLRLLADLIETTFDYSSVAYAMKEDVWQTYVIYNIHSMYMYLYYVLYSHLMCVSATQLCG